MEKRYVLPIILKADLKEYSQIELNAIGKFFGINGDIKSISLNLSSSDIPFELEYDSDNEDFVIDDLDIDINDIYAKVYKFSKPYLNKVIKLYNDKQGKNNLNKIISFTINQDSVKERSSVTCVDISRVKPEPSIIDITEPLDTDLSDFCHDVCNGCRYMLSKMSTFKDFMNKSNDIGAPSSWNSMRFSLMREPSGKTKGFNDMSVRLRYTSNIFCFFKNKSVTFTDTKINNFIEVNYPENVRLIDILNHYIPMSKEFIKKED